MAAKIVKRPDHGITLAAAALKSLTSAADMALLKEMTVADCAIEIRQSVDSLWLFARRGDQGGFALRAVYSPGTAITVESVDGMERDIVYQVRGASGQYQVRFTTPNSEEASIRCQVDITPSVDLQTVDWPRDLFPIDKNGDPSAAQGTVTAAQRGLNAGIVYFTLNEPAFGTLLYFQNFTSLNEYFEVTGTIPDGSVGGNWPDLGFALPGTDTHPLKAGKQVTVSDAYVCWTKEVPETPQQSARIFLELFALIYRRLDRRETEYNNWPALAQQTLNDLRRSHKALVHAYNRIYLHPYTDSEYPDSMVQLTVLMALREFATRDKSAGQFANELLGGVTKFFDDDLGTIRRYLPNVGKDKNKDAVDSWYLYHPVANLGRLALEGDQQAKQQFLASVEFGIKVARHFHYEWPVMFNIMSFEVITGDRKPGDPGQSDTGGLYAYVMVQAYQLTNKERYLVEACKAIEALSNLEFELEYQANITGWGANACLHLYLITEESKYLDQSYVFLASLFHNSVVWESEIGFAKHYRNFLAPTCLHDGPYMALYECYETFAAFHEYLTWGKADLPASVKLLLTEYCKYAPTRAWYYYPANLPKNVIAKNVRNGHIDTALAFPVEDLYADGQPAGQVGQEIYGCGAAFAFVTRTYHRLKNAPFELYCEYPIFDLQEPNDPCISFRVRGVDGFECRARLIPVGGAVLSDVSAKSEEGHRLRVSQTPDGHWEFKVPAGQAIEVEWELKEQS